jgi:hypothetical protein
MPSYMRSMQRTDANSGSKTTWRGVLLSEVFLGKTSNIDIRFAAGTALQFNLFMVVISLVAIARTVPKDDPRSSVSLVGAPANA